MKHEHLSELQFTQLTQELICRATANGALPSDALAALAKALGTLIAFTARREGLANEGVLGASQNAVADYARAANDLHYAKFAEHRSSHETASSGEPK